MGRLGPFKPFAIGIALLFLMCGILGEIGYYQALDEQSKNVVVEDVSSTNTKRHSADEDLDLTGREISYALFGTKNTIDKK